MPAIRTITAFIGALLLVSISSLAVRADDPKTYEITLKEQAFTPLELKVPAGRPFIIKFKNTNAAPAEFEAKEMKIEKVVAGQSEVIVRVKALKPGTYLFVDEYHEDVAKGNVIAE